MKNEKTNLKDLWLNIDKYILVSTFVLIGFGLICIFSASEQLDSKWNLSSNFLFKKHIVFCFVGLVIMFSISQFSTKNLIIISMGIFCLSILLSIAAIFFFPETKGANRWIKIFSYSFQPSELLKPTFIMISALLLSRNKDKNDYSLLINIFFLASISAVLISQPDMGMFILIFGVWILQVLGSNVDKKIISLIFLGFLFVILMCFLFLDHFQFRLMNFLFSDVGDDYQISKSLKSFENGGLFGKGISSGNVSKTLPDAHSDFIFALIGEELGFISAVIILLMYLLIFCRVYYLSKSVTNFFVFTALTGLANILIFQTIINVSSSLGILPTKGMTLPFVSYGGSSLISNSILIGFILALTRECKND